MEEKKTNEAQARARNKWDAEHKENKRKRTAKSGCKTYILKLANAEELNQVKEWIKEAEENL